MSQTKCAVCVSTALREIAGFSELSRVTSDCKPWPAGGKIYCCADCGAVQKIADRAWFDEIKQIYDQYEIYHLSAGAEQVIFADGADAAPRSHTLVDFVIDKAALPEHGRLIDIGCGNGAALANFSRALPRWRLSGSELSDKALADLRRLPNFDTLYTVDIKEVPGEFDVVAMIHALEHMPAPVETMLASRDHLAPNGTLFIEVPDLETSPFDILVADHRMHFTRATLGHLAARSGVQAFALTNEVLPKEITFLGHEASVGAASRPEPQMGRRLVEASIAWLSAVQNDAKNSARAGQFGIFGTSIAGMSLYGAVREHVEFFVDEDRTRVGQSFEGRPILSPNAAPAGSTVYVPLAPPIARAVVARLSKLEARFQPPPDFAS
jgi:2-polyprenyl-3-methyl-5-hydroxy-6-metoxy-1,4-benzoquinol methylase